MTGSVPVVEQTVVPPLTEQIAALCGQTDKLINAARRLSYFLDGSVIEPEGLSDKSITATLTFVIRALNMVTESLDGIAEFYH